MTVAQAGCPWWRWRDLGGFVMILEAESMVLRWLGHWARCKGNLRRNCKFWIWESWWRVDLYRDRSLGEMQVLEKKKTRVLLGLHPLRVGSSHLLSSWRGQPATCVSQDPVRVLGRRGECLRVIAISTVDKPGPHTEDWPSGGQAYLRQKLGPGMF